MYEDGSKARISPRIDFEEHGRTEHLPNRELADQIMHNFPENALTLLDLTNVSELGFENEETEKMIKQFLAELGTS